MKDKEKNDIWGFIAFIAFAVMMFTVGANEAEYLPNTAFFIAFAVQLSVLVYALYKAKAFIWQNAKKEEKRK